MKKINIVSYIMGILLGVFLMIVFLNLSYFAENIRKEVLVYSFTSSSNSQLLVWSLFFIGVLFLVSSFQMNLYIKKPDDKVSLYFSFYSWMIIISIVATIFPYGNWIILLKLVHISTYITLLIFHYYIHAFFNKQVHRFLTYFIWINIGLLIGFTVITSVQIMLILLQYFIIFSLCYLIYISFLSFQQLQNHSHPSIGNFISILILTMTSIQHTLVCYELIEGNSMQGLGLFVFFVIHSALNMERFLNSYSETIVMKNVLQEKVKERTMEIERANKEMRRIENEKSQLISNICHDLSNPITSISIVSKGILGDVIPATNKQYIEEILNQSNLMEKLLTDLRQLNMLESNQLSFNMERVDWYKFSEKMFNNYWVNVKSENIEYVLTLEQAPIQEVTVMIDPLRMEQVFFNIISNSIKYTPVGGLITVIIGLDEVKQQAFLSVSDNGIGIESNQLPLIYDRFYRTKPIRTEKESTGLGLNIVQSIITRHKGSIRVESEQGVGTIFTISIPLAYE